MLKNAPNQADNFVNFSVMKATENQLFSSFAGSDLQAILVMYPNSITLFGDKEIASPSVRFSL